MKVLLTLIFLTVSLYSCQNCSDIACFSPPQAFNFNLVQDDQNIFESRFSKTDIRVLDNNTGVSQDFDYVPYEEGHLIIINTIGWSDDTQLEDYSIQIARDTFDINFTVLAENISEDCCNFTRMSNFTVNELPFETNDQEITTVTLD